MEERPRVLVTHWVHPEVIENLQRDFSVVFNPERTTMPRDRLLGIARECDALVAFMPDWVDEAFLASCPSLRVVACALKGSDNFDIDACTRHGVWLTRVPDLLTTPTAELAIGLAIGVSRRMLAGDDHVRSGTFAGWRPMLYGTGLSGATLGIVGLGAVGRAVAERAAAFGMRILYADPQPADEAWARRHGAVRASTAEVIAGCDYLMPLVHLTPATHHMIDARALATMRRGAHLVNVGRGSVVDEAAVADALAAGQLGGYAADVFEMEDWLLASRPRSIHPALLADRERTFFTPHLGSAVDDARRAIALAAVESVRDVFAGRRPRGAVNDVSGNGPGAARGRGAGRSPARS